MTREERYACIALANCGAIHPEMGRAWFELMLHRKITIERFWQLVREYNADVAPAETQA